MKVEEKNKRKEVVETNKRIKRGAGRMERDKQDKSERMNKHG